MKQVKIYTDGGCDKNPGGTGGWAYLIIQGPTSLECSGRVENTTNNRMELSAAIYALYSLKSGHIVDLYTDSQYLSRGMNEWIFSWIKRGWKVKDGNPVKNVELWQKLHALSQKHQITWNWVKGHADDEYNQRVDKLVQQAMKGKLVNGKAGEHSAAPALPQVKVNKSKGKPVSVTISLSSSKNVRVDTAKELKVDGAQLQKLIEDLIAALRQIEES
ncbi:ribonuclease HI [bacterium]|nr:ribonuclease HI [bacterium]MBU1881527.1 ribonuclease HI [bacterium]